MLGTIPWVENTLDFLKGSPSYTNPGIHRLQHEIFREMGHSEPASEGEIRHIGIEVPRGSPEDYCDPEVFIDEGIVNDHDEFEREWMDLFPDESKWYRLATTQHKGIKYIFINNDLIFRFKDQIDRNQVREDDDYYVTPFLIWILAVLKMSNEPDHEATGLKDLFYREVLAHRRLTVEKNLQLLWEITGPGIIIWN